MEWGEIGTIAVGRNLADLMKGIDSAGNDAAGFQATNVVLDLDKTRQRPPRVMDRTQHVPGALTCASQPGATIHGQLTSALPRHITARPCATPNALARKYASAGQQAQRAVNLKPSCDAPSRTSARRVHQGAYDSERRWARDDTASLQRPGSGVTGHSIVTKCKNQPYK